MKLSKIINNQKESTNEFSNKSSNNEVNKLEKKNTLPKFNKEEFIDNFSNYFKNIGSKKFIFEETENKNQKELWRFENVNKSFGKRIILKDANITINKGQKIAIIGPNGSGKSTFVKMLVKKSLPNSGKIFFAGKDENALFDLVAYQQQEIEYPEGFKLNDLISLANQSKRKDHSWPKEKLNYLLELFGLDDKMKMEVSHMSGGEKQRVNLLITILQRPKVLILDELTTALDITIYNKVINFIEKYIRSVKGTLILISHRFDEIQRLTNQIYHIANGEITEYRTSELDIKKYKSLISISDSHFIKRDKLPYRRWYLKPSHSQNTFSKNNKLVIHNLNKTYKGKRVLDRLDFTINQGDKIALVGANGSGKTTLAELISRVISEDDSNRAKIFYNHLKTKLNVRRLYESVEVYRRLINSIPEENLKEIEKINLKITDIENEIERITSYHKIFSWKELFSLWLGAPKRPIKYWWSDLNWEITTKIGMQFQEATFLPELMLKDVVKLFVNSAHNDWTDKMIKDVLIKLKLAEHVNTRVDKLSGGQKQKLNILVSILKEPYILILDEISSGLDIESQEEILAFLNDYISKNKITLIIISHSAIEIKKLTNRMHILENGRISERVINVESRSVNEIENDLIEILS